MKMGKIMLEDYIILCIENKKVRIIYDAGNTDLYLWKYGSFYLSRDWLSIIPNCPKENIILIDRNKGILQCCKKSCLKKIIRLWYFVKNHLVYTKSVRTDSFLIHFECYWIFLLKIKEVDFCDILPTCRGGAF